MTYLLDVNVLIALAWPSHVHHASAQAWFQRHGRRGWASCPLTQTGFVRISSNPKFIDGAVSPAAAAQLLDGAIANSTHEFWTDELNVVVDQVFGPLVVGHRQVTDAYLLALARRHGSKLATFDARVESLLGDAKERKTLLEVIV